ncbi:transporter substrate-binding domain-containing protein [Thalassomonas sp. RHCl1]|uniref:substrate-binding periplasmic protein n=1 Tax=Thalassomonas sp. RHCl1 TaxID=2995320 RepID=UPI00248ACFAF|nr:transporter substrate-binding domain-containing protein [Thalassomonas sp. RHCl1]
MTRSVIYAFLMYFLTGALLRAETITMATAEWSPFYGADLPKQGGVSEITRQALKRSGHEVTIHFMPWARAMHDVKEGKYHGVLGCWANKQVRKDYLVSQEVMGSGDGHFLAKKASPDTELIPEALRGKVVGFVRGYPVSETLNGLFGRREVGKSEVSHIGQLYGLLELKRIDLILENYQVAKYHFFKNFPGEEFDLKIVGKDYVDGGLYMCWSRSKAGIEAIAEAFDRAIRQMRTDGSLEKIEQAFGF